MRMITSHHVVAVHVHPNFNYYCHKMYPPWPSLICSLLLSMLFSIEFGMHQAMASPLTSCTFNDNNNQNDDHPIEESLPPSSSFLFKSAASSSSLPSSSADPFALSKCACESDWADAFCTRLDHYARMEPEKAPSVCICRQMAGPRQCRQFLSRCFHRPPPPLSVPVLPFSPNAEIGHQLPRHRPNPLADQCACCFNQPDQFCNQLECQQMWPIFDPVANTTCRCFFPKGDWQQKMGRKTATTSMEEYPPEQICADSNQHWPRRVEINDNEEEAAGNKIDEADNTGKYSSSWSPQTSLANLLNSKAPYARLVSLLLLALLASLLLAVLVCFWSHWRRIRRGRRKAKVEADGGEQPATEECVVVVTSTSQLNLDEDEDDSSHSPPQQQPQWNGTTMDRHNQQQQLEKNNNNNNNNIVEKAAAANEKRRKTKKSTKLRDENGALLQEATV